MSNNEAIKMLVRLKDCINFEVTDAQCKMDALNMAIKSLEQKTGHWIGYKCSECGTILDFSGINGGYGDANYCPNCGIKMVDLDKEG